MNSIKANLNNTLNQLLWSSDESNLIAFFRICFGLVVCWEFGQLAMTESGLIKYLNTVFHFKYPFLEWVVQAPDPAMKIIFWLGLCCSILFTVGLFYRVVSILVFMLYTYIFLLDVSYWNNHYFLYVLLLFTLIFIKANHSLSIDQYLKKQISTDIPSWNVNLLLTLFAIPLIFGAFSKLLNPDWFNHVSMENLLTSSFIRNGWEVNNGLVESVAPIFTYGGFFFDLLIVPILLYKRTYWFGVFFALIFNGTNFFLLNIGSFPVAMLSSLILFFPKNGLIIPRPYISNHQRTKSFMILLFVTTLLILPFRHLLIEGNVFWTSEGKVGAWNMMSGSTTIQEPIFYLVEHDDNGNIINEEKVSGSVYLNSKQIRTIGLWPALSPQFAKFLKREAELAGFNNVFVYADIRVSRNGRHAKPIVSDKIDLSSTEFNYFGHNPYVLLYLEEGY